MVSKPLAKKKGDLLQCLACNRYCNIPNGQAGYCGVRANDNGKLNLLVYGKPCAVWVDPIEKKPLFHFMPGSESYSIGTFGCDFACDFCQNSDISQAPQNARKQDPVHWRDYFEGLIKQCRELPPDVAVREAVGSGCKSISFTYNEPTIFTEYALDVMNAAKSQDLKFVYVTNGYESKECWKTLKGRLHAANIDLKAFNDSFYRSICKATLEPVLDSIRIAKKYSIHLEITTLLIPGKNDKPEELRELASFIASVDKDMPWHVTSFHPSYQMLSTPATEPEQLIRAREIGKDAGLRYVYIGNVPLAYSDYESTYCPKCGKVLVNRMGYSVTNKSIIGGKCRFCNEKINGIWES